MSKEIVYSFDVDGVLTKPEQRKPNPRLLDFIASKLGNHLPIALITGRTPHWLLDSIIQPLTELIKDRKVLDNLFVSSEKATVVIDFQNGNAAIRTIENYRVPRDIWEGMKRLAKGSNAVFFDERKVNIPSLEIIGGDPATVIQQKKTLQEMKRVIEHEILPRHPEFIVLDEPGIALDVQDKNVDKAHAGGQFVEFVRTRGHKNPHFMVFGDTVSDLRVAERIHTCGQTVSFAYVGDKDLPPLPFQVIKPEGKELFDAGTLAVLRSLGEL